MARTFTHIPDPHHVEKANKTNELPEITSADAGKVLGIDDEGNIIATEGGVPENYPFETTTLFEHDEVVVEDSGYYGIVLGDIAALENYPPEINISITPEIANNVTLVYHSDNETYTNDEETISLYKLSPEDGFYVSWSSISSADEGKTFSILITQNAIEENFSDATNEILSKKINESILELFAETSISDDQNPTDVTLLFTDNAYKSLNTRNNIVVSVNDEKVNYSTENGGFISTTWSIVYDDSDDIYTFTPNGISLPITIKLYNSYSCKYPSSYTTEANNNDGKYPSAVGDKMIYSNKDTLIFEDDIYGENGSKLNLVALGNIRAVAYRKQLLSSGQTVVPAGGYAELEVYNDNGDIGGKTVLPIPSILDVDYIIIPTSITIGFNQRFLFHNISNNSITIGGPTGITPEAIIWVYEPDYYLEPTNKIISTQE